MAVVTSQILNRYYNDYLNTEIAFSKEIVRALKMDPRQIYIKSGGSQWPCIVNSTSFDQCKIILSTSSGAYEEIKKSDPPPVSIRYSFYKEDGQIMSFFISGKVFQIQPYMNSTDLAIITIKYTQRPADDFIQMLGELLEANINAVKRREERIAITQDSMRKMGLSKKEIIAVVQNVPRHCIIQDLSFGGAKIVLLGLAQFLMNKEIVLQLEFEDPHETLNIKGVIVGVTGIEGRKDLIVASVMFDNKSLNINYKIHINKYITTVRKNELNYPQEENVEEAQPAE